MASNKNIQWGSDDEGDDIFDGHDTVATIPISRQPNGSTHVTQPTQPLHYSPPRSPVVQVANSSPRVTQSPLAAAAAASSHRPAASAAHGAGFASAMAPPGTAFRNPTHQSSPPPESQRSQAPKYSTQGAALTDSEEEDSAGIKPTTFINGNRPSKVEESPQRTTFAQYEFPGFGAPGENSLKRGSDAMASGYISDRPAKQQRVGESVARPQTKGMSLDDITDSNTRLKVERILNILPNNSVLRAYTGLIRSHGNEQMAMTWLVEKAEQESAQPSEGSPQPASPAAGEDGKPKQTAKRVVQKSKSIADKYSSTQQASRATSFAESLLARGTPGQSSKPPPPTQPAKKTVTGSKPIGQKWSSTGEKAYPKTDVTHNADDASPAKQRKRLIAGRDSAASSPRDSPAPLRPEQNSVTKRKNVIDLDDISDGADSGMGSEAEAEVSDAVLDGKILEYTNTCSALDLMDLTSQSKDNVDLILSRRPFKDLDALKAVFSESKSTTKTGKIRTARNAVGEKMYDTLYDMFQGYDAVDELVKTCEGLGKPVADEMKQWGFDVFGASQEGEVELTTLEPAHDSGLGTPASSLGPESDEEPKSKRRSKFIGQPPNMSEKLVMKDYQIAGLNWLALLFSNKLSCILADDMGLGKTCQVIAFLAHLKAAELSSGPHIIIVPGSTLENWLREFQNFCPRLRVEPYYGKQAERVEMQYRIQQELADINVIVTTYDMASKKDDAHFLKKLRPIVCVYDEGHALKNSQSQRYKELMRIPAEFRLLLTGTPLQNNLQELISLLAFIMPHVFKEKEETLASIFKHRAKTTDKEHTALLSAERISRARSMMTPFILRRKKRQVLRHLPEKTTRVEYCDLVDSQQKLYDECARTVRSAFENAQEEAKKLKSKKDTNKSRGAYSSTKLTQNVLMELRKAALHPMLFRRLYTDELINKIAVSYQKTHPQCDVPALIEDFSIMTDFEIDRFCKAEEQASNKTISRLALKDEPWLTAGKVTKLIELVKGWAANGERTLVFSQFTMVLDLLELVFTSADIGFYRLDGSTAMSTRQDLLDAFHGDDTPVFMLSTKAGGAGINLACANKVVIFDMSFNPQDDVQAENRAHRVGQVREVEVVRLVSRGTIEEQILRLGESKLALDREVAGEAEKSSEDDEKKGEGAVLDMFLNSTAASASTGPATFANDDAPDAAATKKPAAKQGDIKDQFMNGLKKSGLDMSAAESSAAKGTD